MRGIHGDRLHIPYTSQGFPGGTVPRAGYLETDWGDLLWAALTVGRPNTAYVFRHGEASYHEALFRLSLIRLALEQQRHRWSLYRTEAFSSLDPTEKGAVSYFLGMAVCKLFATDLLDTPWLLHLDVFRDQLSPAVLGGRSRPDLVGQDANGAWHAFECKGRSSIPTAEDMRKAKRQAQRLVRVDSTNCSLNIGAISFFRQDALQFHWRDPDPEEPEPGLHGRLRRSVCGDTPGAVRVPSNRALSDAAVPAKPSRITARVRLGRGEILDIEREIWTVRASATM